MRELQSSQPDCKELAETMALAIAIAIDPLSAERLSAAATTSSQPVRKEGQSRDREPAPYLDGRRPPAPPTPTPLRKESGGTIVVRSMEVGVSGLFSVGAAPAVAGALALHGGYRWPRFSVSLEGRFDFPATVDVLGGVVESSLILGSARGCFHHGWLYGCGFFAGGALRASGGAVDREAKVTLPFVALGGRLGGRFPVIAALSFRLHADLLAPLTRITLREADTDEELLATPPVSAAFGLSAVGHFLQSFRHKTGCEPPMHGRGETE